jgi:outer membrane protein with beta-barrel domain
MFWSTRAAGAVVFASVAAVTLTAQGVRPQFGIGAGLMVPVGDYHATASGQGFKTAWQGLALFAFKLPSLPVGFRVDVTYGANSANDRLKADLTTALGQPTDEQAKLVGATLNVTYPASSPARVKPYLVGGIGVYHATISVSQTNATTHNSKTKLAGNLGGGIVYGLPGVALFLEARYVNVAPVSGFPRTTFVPITTGVRFGGR